MELIALIDSGKNVFAIIERLPAMSEGACVLAWAKSNGFIKYPTDCSFQGGITLTTMGHLLRNITPITELNELEKNGGDPNPKTIF